MADYSSLGSQITALKNSINTLLAGSTNSQDLVFVSTALNTAGTMLGVNDIVAATNTQLSAISTAGSNAVTSVSNQEASSIAAVVSAQANFVNYFFTMGA